MYQNLLNTLKYKIFKNLDATNKVLILKKKKTVIYF